jgi:biotin carboxyl carrier protein
MEENKWDTGEDDEELFEFAMHETQYRDYKSGLAKKRFEEEIEKIKNQAASADKGPVKGSQTAKKTNYTMKEVDYPYAMVAFALYSMNTSKIEEVQENNKHDIWKAIGYWRNQMKIDITYEDKVYSINLKQAKPDEYLFMIGDKSIEAKVNSIQAGQIDVVINKETYKTTISKGEEGFTKVSVNDKDFQMMRNDLLEGDLATSDDDSVSADEENNILAPLPGRIFKINVKDGDKIAKGDVVLVIDAMKMENNIVAKKDAVAKKVLVQLDEMVEAGVPLVELG